MTKPKVSIVINLDTRPENLRESEMGKGVVHRDFILEGIRNKKAFFKGCDCEVIAFIDIHTFIDPEILKEISKEVTTLVLRKHQPWGNHHTHESQPNDYNYAHALGLARGEYIAHFDMDVVAFSKDATIVHNLLASTHEYGYVCYPSAHSPAPCHDESFNYWWASTRFFLCRSEIFKGCDIEYCIQHPKFMDYAYPSPKKLYWTEHILGRFATAQNKEKAVIYPPFALDRYAIWTWKSYIPGLMAKLNQMNYEQIQAYINKAGGIFYVCDLEATGV